jgi:hypothetical protein
MFISTTLQVYESKAHTSLSNFSGTTTNNPVLSLQASGTGNNIITVEDPEIARENPVEAKHRRLVRSHRNGPLDRELKPNPKIRDELAVRTDLVIERIPCSIAKFSPFSNCQFALLNSLANPEIPTITLTHSGRKGFALEVQILFNSRQTGMVNI